MRSGDWCLDLDCQISLLLHCNSVTYNFCTALFENTIEVCARQFDSQLIETFLVYMFFLDEPAIVKLTAQASSGPARPSGSRQPYYQLAARSSRPAIDPYRRQSLQTPRPL